MAQPAQETWRSGLPRHRGRISQAPKQPHQTKFNTVQAQSISSCLQKASHLATLLLKVLQPVLDVKRKGPIQGPTHCEETCGRVQSQLQGRIGLQSEAEGGRLGGRLQQDLRSLLVREQNPAAGDGRTVRGKDTRRAGMQRQRHPRRAPRPPTSFPSREGGPRRHRSRRACSSWHPERARPPWPRCSPRRRPRKSPNKATPPRRNPAPEHGIEHMVGPPAL